MKKFLQSATSLAVAFALICAPVVDAQTRGRQGRSSSTSSTSQQQRPAQNGGNSGATNYRNQGTTSGSRPSTPGNNSASRPGNQPSGNFNPGANNRPGNTPANRPGPQPNNRPGYGQPAPPPPAPPRPYRPMAHPADYRHPVPFFNSYHRPAPPASWHYVGGGPTFGSILGLALGTALGVSLATLANNGYSVSSYGNNVVYLNNVPQMNYNWPDAALYYNNGVLCGSQFTYPTAYYDMGRYNSLYNVFVNQYGVPISTSNRGGVISSNWFGPNGRYVTLTYGALNGHYYTTLSFGN